MPYVSKLDRSSLRDLMETYGSDVWNYIYCMTRKVDSADDLTQEVFIRVYEKMESFRGECSVRTWLFTIARRLVLNYKRSAFIRKVFLVDWITRTESSPSAESEALSRIHAHTLWEYVLELPEPYREALMLDASYGLPVKEMAQLLGIPEGTVKSRIARARTRIASKLKEDAPYERT
ncbi:RNA polymerase sigma factor [Paenibacillus sp. HJGM_3]|uniref:RNA polymerase sigma factor n=1 Tax=Paenibacillus sp. HJGM_3 TaxID=3379816 RepID=UPI00385ECADE